MRHTNATLNKIKKLRREGRSIPQIVRETGLSKTTIWHHIQGIILSPEQIQNIRSLQGGSRLRCKENWNKANVHAQALLSSTKDIQKLARVAGMLYWAEGSKRELVFTNTDIDMIKIYIAFLNQCLGVTKDKIFILVRISDPIKPKEALRFWTDGTGISVKNLKFNHNNIQNSTKSKYGICRVSIPKGAYSLKVIHCIIDAVKKELLPL